MRVLYLDAYLGRGIARLDRGDLREAREDFEQALEYPKNIRIGRPPRPSDARAHWCAAAACDALGDRTAAAAHWEAAAAESHHDPGEELALYRALSLGKLGRTEEAQTIFAEALKLARQCADSAPDDAAAQFSLGLTLQAMGRGDEARPFLRRAVELDSGMHRAQRLLEGQPIL
jgi:tetratricopeptide (TPR) repeat protein